MSEVRHLKSRNPSVSSDNVSLPRVCGIKRGREGKRIFRDQGANASNVP